MMEVNHSCPNCEAAASRAASDAKRITDLESQLQWLTIKASAADFNQADKLADYEDHLRNVDALPSGNLSQRGSVDATLTPPRRQSYESRSTPPKSPALVSVQGPEKRSNNPNRFQAFLNRRGPATANAATTPLQATSTSSGTSSIQDDLSNQLQNERHARISAEESLLALQAELEELSAALFSQANEMVADERRMRAKDVERLQASEEQAAFWESQARQLEGRCKWSEQEVKRWAVKAQDLETRTSSLEPRSVESRSRDEQRWKRVEALERAVERLSVTKNLLDESPKASRRMLSSAENMPDGHNITA